MSKCMGLKLGRIATALLGAVVLTLLTSRSANAYVDPNSAGPIYQFLFPLLLAAASVLAAFRRALGRMWQRVATVVLGMRRTQRVGQRSPD